MDTRSSSTIGLSEVGSRPKIHASLASGRRETSMRGNTGNIASGRVECRQGAAARANTHPPQAAALRCPTRHPVRNRLFEARASTRVVPTGIEPALSSKTWPIGTQKVGQKRHTRGPQGRCRFDAFVGDGRAAWRRAQSSHEAARATTKDMAPPSSPAAADDHPAASWGQG